MVRDRNLAVHTYNEPLAEETYGRLRRSLPLMDAWIAAMERGPGPA